ncbi:MAG TPA: YggS family pyridoxal phosphate-dependent enzyme [Anaerolineae bacterium]|nr:YggS family pyridoxal phosphate-dependent enzyme [Anaerolineae bacterium]
MGLSTRLSSVLGRISAAASRARRDPAAVCLVAVCKTVPIDTIRAAYDLGLRHFGENRVEEAATKAALLPPDITWHMIGHIQSRKAKQVLLSMQVVHSVDSVRLAARLDRLSAQRPERLPVLVQINVSGEASKGGFGASGWLKDPEGRQRLFSSIGQVVALPHIKVEGLMTIAPIVADAEDARGVFIALRRLRDELRDTFPDTDWRNLSMGMTDDFEVAIEEGATMVRIGRAIFAGDDP